MLKAFGLLTSEDLVASWLNGMQTLPFRFENLLPSEDLVASGLNGMQTWLQVPSGSHSSILEFQGSPCLGEARRQSMEPHNQDSPRSA